MIHPWNQALFSRLAGEGERLPHALLLQGPKGVGKLDLALELARWALCEQPSAQGACGQCGACHWFEQGNHPDFRRVEPEDASQDDESGRDVETAAKGKSGKKPSKVIKIEQVRAVSEFLSLTSHRGGWRVAVFHPAELMQPAAANALLKTLEEPPVRVLLILVAHQSGRLLPTVISRCRRVDMALPPRAEGLAWLRDQGVAAAAAPLDEAGGAPLAALDYLEPEYAARREAFLDLLAEPARLEVCGAAETYKAQPTEVWNWLSRWLHDLILQRQAGRSRYFPERALAAAQLAQRADLAGLLGLQRQYASEGRSLRHPLNATLLLESWLLRYGEIFGGAR